MSELKNIRLKVCGLRDNINEVTALKPDFVGFIFYKESSRYVGDALDQNLLHAISPDIMKVGVFVNENVENILEVSGKYKLDYVQLHGDEKYEDCLQLSANGLGVIKVFPGNKEINREQLLKFSDVIDYYLFDTRAIGYGGSGETFNWDTLRGLDLPRPVILSGGLNLENIQELEGRDDLNIFAIDINSQFEKTPGLKDITLLQQLKHKMRPDYVSN